MPPTPLPPLPKADITHWSLSSFTLNEDAGTESFSTQWSRQPLPRDQSWHTRWNLFIIPVQDSLRTQIRSRRSTFKQWWKLCFLFAQSLFILTVCLILVSFISCHLIYQATEWKSKLIKSWDFTGVNSTNSRKPGYWQKSRWHNKNNFRLLSIFDFVPGPLSIFSFILTTVL